jgi:hypothetical protein
VSATEMAMIGQIDLRLVTERDNLQ